MKPIVLIHGYSPESRETTKSAIRSISNDRIVIQPDSIH